MAMIRAVGIQAVWTIVQAIEVVEIGMQRIIARASGAIGARELASSTRAVAGSAR